MSSNNAISTHEGITPLANILVSPVCLSASNLDATQSPQGGSLLNITLGSGLSATAGAFYDNVSLAVVPEPASLVTLGLAGLAFKRRR